MGAAASDHFTSYADIQYGFLGTILFVYHARPIGLLMWVGLS